MNQAPVGLENGADRAATSRENPVLFPAPNESFRENGSFYLLQRNIKAKTGLEEAVVNQATVWPESGADRAAASRKNPVLFPAPKKKSSAKAPGFFFCKLGVFGIPNNQVQKFA